MYATSHYTALKLDLRRTPTLYNQLAGGLQLQMLQRDGRDVANTKHLCIDTNRPATSRPSYATRSLVTRVSVAT